MPTDFDSSGIAANVSIGYGANSPQIKFTAPNKSCIWNDYPVQILVAPAGCSVSDPAPTNQIATYTTPGSAGPWAVPAANMPFLWVYDYWEASLCGYRLEVRVTGESLDNPMQVDVVNAYGGSWTTPSTYYTGGFDTGWTDPGGPDCAQAATAPNGAIYLQVTVRQFNPTLSSIIAGAYLQARYVSVDSPADWSPKQSFGVFFSPPNDKAVRYLKLGDDSGASPPSSDWLNSIVPGDAGMEDASGTPYHGVFAVGGGHGTMWWNTRRFPAQQAIAAYAVPGPSGADAMYLFLRLTDPGTAGVDGYMLKGMATTCETYRIDNGTATLLDTFTLPFPMARAFAYRFWATGSLLGVQANMADPDYFGSQLPFVGSSSDATYAGDDTYVGVGLDGSTAEIVIVDAGGSSTVDMPGLTIRLATNSCGVIGTSFTAIKSAIDAMNGAGTCPITATILGGHGADLAGPTAGSMTGAHCTGGTAWREGQETD